MPAQITNYQCPACTGPLHFDGASGKLVCDYCGSSFDVKEIEAQYAQKDAGAQAAFAARQQAEQAERAAQPADGAAPQPAAAPPQPAAAPPQPAAAPQSEAYKKSKWDGSTISADWGEEGGELRAYNCPSCGAELICNVSTAATQCPYCGNPSIVPGQFAGALKPDCLIPFKLKKEDAVAALKQHFSKRIFLPKTFTRTSQINKLQGVYVPFWLFSGSAKADCAFEGQNSTVRREGNYRVTRTDHFDVRRSGTVTFDRVPVDASQKMPDEVMDSLEPYDYSGFQPFSTAYLPGFVANKYDVTVDESAQRADTRCQNTAVDAMRSDVHGYQTVLNRKQNVAIARGKVQYALLPVWLLLVSWNNNNYLFAMNGQTGKMVGDLPVSRGRFWALCGGLTVLLSALVFFSGAGGIAASFLQELIS